MKRIQKALPETKQIEVNGHIFDIRKTDMDIMEKALQLQNNYAKLGSGDIEGISKSVRSIIDYIDEILGEGAVDKITEGRPVGITYSTELMVDICTAVFETYNETVAEKYD